jgi:hypothetical protein
MGELMSKREMTMERYNEIKRLLELKVPVLTISQTQHCTERTVRQIRDGITPPPDTVKFIPGPTWTEGVEWDSVLKEVLEGHPIKFIWAERAQDQVGYKAFWEQFHKKFPSYKMASSVHREFAPGERCEVDYAGDRAKWVNIQTGEIHEMDIFVGILGFSQLIFADATDDQTNPNFIASHGRMFEAFGGVPRVTAPDCLKQGVTRTHLYDPDINKNYQCMAEHYGTAIVPARPSSPKDKALVEGAVRLIYRSYRWITRGRVLVSPEDVRASLKRAVEMINSKPHSRFKISRLDSWSETEKTSLKPLPARHYEYCIWKVATVHPDCHVGVDSAYYSAPHHLRGQRVKIKLSENTVEIFFSLERVALHVRDRHRKGHFVTELSHLPDNARAYLETTPQNVLSQAKFLSVPLHALIDEMFKQNAIGHLRRCQGFVREARHQINRLGADRGRESIAKAVETMQRFSRLRTPYFKELLNSNHQGTTTPENKSKIKRQPNNPMLRHTGGAQLELVTNQNTGEKHGDSPN